MILGDFGENLIGIGEMIGRGAYGYVYIGHPNTGSQVAMKKRTIDNAVLFENEINILKVRY